MNIFCKLKERKFQLIIFGVIFVATTILYMQVIFKWHSLWNEALTYRSNKTLIKNMSKPHSMTAKPGSENYHPKFKCEHCDFTSMKHVDLVLHCKEEHDIELWVKKTRIAVQNVTREDWRLWSFVQLNLMEENGTASMQNYVSYAIAFFLMMLKWISIMDTRKGSQFVLFCNKVKS